MQYETTKLQPIKSFPTYQLHVQTVSETLSVNDIFKICILETMKWLRSRLKQFSVLPEELNFPEPEEYATFSETALHSFSLHIGINIEVAYLEKEGIWSFQLSETDMGANIGTAKERPPVHGRTFRTEFSFRKQNYCVETGIRTICSDLANCTAPCEVFRPYVVKAIASRKDMEFHYHGFRLDGSPLMLNSRNSLNYLDALLSHETVDIPLIFVAESGYEDKNQEQILQSAKNLLSASSFQMKGTFSLSPPLPSQKEMQLSISNMPLNNDHKKEKAFLEEKKKEPKKKQAVPAPNIPERVKLPEFPYQKLASSVLGFAIVCYVEKKLFSQIQNKFGITLHDGEIIVCDTEPEHYSYAQYQENIDAFYWKLNASVKQMPKRHAYQFENVLFYSDARLKELHDKRKAASSAEEQCTIYREENVELKRKLRECLQQHTESQMQAEHFRMIEKKLQQKEDELAGLKIYCEALQTQNQEQKLLLQNAVKREQFFRNMLEIAALFPTDKEKICEWIEKYFSGQLIVTSKAKSALHKYAGALQTEILCDGIVYLNAYVLYRNGDISQEELQLYAERYHWEAGSCGKEALKLHKEEYTATYDGKKYLMNLHLRYGIRSQVLIRIYFCYDETLKKGIIGHMPSHLATVKQST